MKSYNDRAAKRSKRWSSKLLGSGTLEYYSDMNTGINATIHINNITAEFDKFPKISEIGFSCTCEGRRFVIKINVKQLKIWKTQLSLGIPVTTEQRISFI